MVRIKNYANKKSPGTTWLHSGKIGGTALGARFVAREGVGLWAQGGVVCPRISFSASRATNILYSKV